MAANLHFLYQFRLLSFGTTSIGEILQKPYLRALEVNFCPAIQLGVADWRHERYHLLPHLFRLQTTRA